MYPSITSVLKVKNQSYRESSAPPVGLEYVPAMQAVHAEDPAKSHPGAPRRIRAAVTAIHLADATASGPRRQHTRALPSLPLAWRMSLLTPLEPCPRSQWRMTHIGLNKSSRPGFITRPLTRLAPSVPGPDRAFLSWSHQW